MPFSEQYSHHLLYATVRMHILSDIESGVYRENEQIPTESELCKKYDVSRITIRKAVSDLVKHGVLIRWRGKGTFVQAQKVKNELLHVSGFTDFGVLLGKKTREEIIKKDHIPAAEYGTILGISPDSIIFRLVRVMWLADEPLFIDYSSIPLSRYPDFDKLYQPGQSTYQLLQDRFATQVVSDRKVIAVNAATKAESKRLKCDVGEPLFRIEKIAYDQRQHPVHYSEFYCRAGRINLTIDNHRTPVPEAPLPPAA